MVQTDGLLHLLVVYQLAHRATLVSCHALHDVVALRVHSAVVKRIVCTRYAEESGTLHERHRSETRHLLQFCTRMERTVLFTIFHDVLCRCGVQTAHIHQQVTACRVEVYAHRVDARLHHHVQALLQLALVHVVLVLSHADALRVNLHKLRQRIHQTSAYRHRAAHRDILVRKLLTCSLRSGVYRSAVLAYHESLNVFIQPYRLEERRCLTACRTVAHGNGLDVVTLHHVAHLTSRLLAFVLRWVRIDGFEVE